MAGKLQNKIALVTGASKGIGRATVELFAEQGAEIFCPARSLEKLEELKKNLEQKGARIHIKQTDLGKSSEIEELFKFISDHADHLDSVVNCAGTFEGGRINEISVENFDKVINMNLRSPFLICKHAIPLLEKSGAGTIVNISSLSGCFGLQKFAGFGAYDISKYGLWGLTEILDVELKDKNIRVNQVSPGGVDTEMYYRATGATSKPGLEPHDVAGVILYLASDESAPLSGENLRLFGK
ncbi:MAG: SDR family NAD(P)-dependent oxidoreductase [candidate division Zixibacteria bacterium]|nr:SDR family NAD(P)-dependent oxidoreductase [candidate division Zixibacteria bacterium]